MIKHTLEHGEFPAKCLTLLKIEVLQYLCSAVWTNVWREGEYAEGERASAVSTSGRLQFFVPMWQGSSNGWIWLMLTV